MIKYVGLFLIGIGVFYYLVIFLPKDTQAKRELEAKAALEKANMEAQKLQQEEKYNPVRLLDECLEKENKWYVKILNIACDTFPACRANGSVNFSAIPAEPMSNIEKDHKASQDEC